MRSLSRLVLVLLALAAPRAFAAPGDWSSCFPLAAGTCSSATDLIILGSTTLSSASASAIPANRCVEGTTGLICQGATKDAFQTLITVTDPTADRTFTIPNVTGTAVTTGDTGSITSAMILDGTVTSTDILDATITGTDIASATITGSNVASATITADNLGNGAGSQGMLVYCGQQANAGTTYLGSAAEPNLFSLDPFLRVVGDTTCDAYANATEATADHIANADLTLKVTGMLCTVETTPGATTTYTLRSAAADTTPVVSCTIASGGPKSCRANAATTTAIAANATLAVKAVDTTNESAVGALCRVFYLLP